MKPISRALAAVIAVSAAAGCRGERRCNDRTVLLSINLAGGAQGADEIEVRPAIEGESLTGGRVSRRPGEVSGTIEVVLADRYRTDAVVTILVIARANGAVLAEDQVVDRLAAICTRLSLTLGPGAGDGGRDASDTDTLVAFDAGTPPGDGPTADRGGSDAAPVDGPPAADAPPPVADASPDRGPDLAPDTPPLPTRKRIFVTKAGYTGALGGLAGAHAQCTQLANAAGLTGSYMAWLSTAAAGPASFMTPSPVPYVLPSGEMVAASWADLIDGNLLRPIDRDQNGDPSTGAAICEGGEVWTNTTTAGTPIGSGDCAGWTSQATTAALASSAGNLRFSTARWTNSGCISIGCNFPLPIYCLEQ
jgi:hypothetical protein